ncbi:MAG: thioredoxin domain-containing protein [Candidatus Eremiobacteraeota bacterium]|nr:thioredoxin domain-containing protein [Candidatus Eremiobacteraeota bacterium]MBV8654416.1 thioredoxin domain-containing protein [Candidatus Eremiobacteraeota bacterium]
MNDFRFSPRPNRASEIGWMTWGTHAFDRARSEDKPILLSISAVWCHWCHVMDETSYSDESVIAAINERFVPVRVDNDRRPDVNARYNMGGWPTTAFLAPDGSTLTGATYLPPAQMRRALDEIATFYRENKAAIAERTLTVRAKRAAYRPAAHDELRDAMIVRLLEEIVERFDEEYGGFGDAPKFPQPEVHEFLLGEWRLSGERRLYDVVAKTMLGMSRGGTYDRAEGGFFRYSTTRDWSVPHFEKMAEDHAGLLRVLCELVSFGAANEFRPTLVSAAGYVRRVLRDAQTGLFAGSQDADEEYYALPLEERRERGAPYVDRTSYTNWSCGLAGALAWTARALDDDAMLAEALQTLDYVHEHLLDGEGLTHHFVEPGGPPQVRGLLADQVAYARALLDAHEVAGEARFLDRARLLADRTIERFSAEDGGFFDRVPGDDAHGNLEIADRPIGDNGTFAECLLRLAALAGEQRYRDAAERTLALFARTYAAAGPFAAPYARALRRYLAPELTVRIVGQPAATGGFREAAFRLPNPLVTIRTGDSTALGLPADPAPAAYVCAGATCAAPAAEPAAIRSAYDAVAG